MQKLKNIYHFLASWFWTILYGYPVRNLKVVFVTGTDGKTTTANLIYHILREEGIKTGLIGSTGAYIGNKEIDTGLHTTTPANRSLQKMLKDLVQFNCEYVVIEYTAHGIDQNRIVGARAKLSVFTNITSEHLDYFGTMDHYIEAKAKLIPLSEVSLFNRDDDFTKTLVTIARRLSSIYKQFGKDDIKDVHLLNKYTSKFPGEYNLENAAAALLACRVLGIDERRTIQHLNSATTPAGRFEKIVSNQGVNVIIDFAHTPNSLSKLLKTNVRGNKIVVFGCAGLRDAKKRPVMGSIAAQSCAFTVITAEDPRTEILEAICEDIATGCRQAGAKEGEDYFVIYDRSEAIEFALRKLAKPGDYVFITGKGHEKSLCLGTTEYPWSDQEAVKLIIRNHKL
jgi:UDP-N-acetylmuramoyl-L-alanyl-D-glutamate--2,6-diaminopimelate ligase